MAKPITDPIERIMKRITITESGCWEYHSLNAQGYGVIGVGGDNGPRLRVHRVTYERFVGPIPDGLCIDHLCRNRACCNPDHLEPVTQAENVKRGVRKTKQTRCKWGHEFTPENTTSGSKGERACRECIEYRIRVIRTAVKALGIGHTQYRAQYGQSIRTAERILNELENAS